MDKVTCNEIQLLKVINIYKKILYLRKISNDYFDTVKTLKFVGDFKGARKFNRKVMLYDHAICYYTNKLS